MHEALARLVVVADRQFGVFSRRQAVAAGFSDDAIDRRVASGQWLRVFRKVYRVAGAPLSLNGQLVAATLSTGGGAVSHATAAATLYEIEGCSADRRLHVSVERPRRVRSSEITVHHVNALRVTTYRGVPVTTPARTILDVAGGLTLVSLEVALDDAIRRLSVRPKPFLAELRSLAPFGRSKYRDLEAMLVERVGERVTGSGRETVFRTLIRTANLPQPVAQFEICDERGVFVARPDFVYPDLKIAIEIDTVSWHSGRRRIGYDSHRQNRLVALGWTVLRFSRTMIDDTPTQVIASVSATIARVTAMATNRA